MNTKSFGMLVIRYSFYSRDLVRVWMGVMKSAVSNGDIRLHKFLTLGRIGVSQYVLQKIPNFISPSQKTNHLLFNFL